MEPAVVSLPLGARGKRPVLVAAHGAGGRARIHCELWRRIVQNRGFIVCPRGHRMYPPETRRYFYDGHPALAREIRDALASLARQYPDQVDMRDPVYAGYSQGAVMGSMMLPTHSARFARAMLVEGGFGEYQEWNIAAAKRFYRNGARRVLLVCGRSICFRHAKSTARWMRMGGLQAEIRYAAGAGHTYAGPMPKVLREGFAWLVEGDARWADTAKP